MAGTPDLPKTPRLRVEVLPRGPYGLAHARMKALLEARVAGEGPDTLLLCEHEPVYTLGRARNAANHLLNPGDVPVVEVERGGDVTFHGPGQLVAYPVVGLPEHGQDLRAYLQGLQEVGTRVLRRFGVEGGPDPRNTGVWVGDEKLVSIGIACRRWVCWHGFAINLDVDLEYFRRVMPCGLEPERIGRLADHVEGPTPRLRAVADATAAEFRSWWLGFLTDRGKVGRSAGAGGLAQGVGAQ